MKKINLLIKIIIPILVIALSSYSTNRVQGYTPKNGFVPDEATAAKIAEAILVPIYGQSILEMRPFKVELVDSTVWVVRGVSPPKRGKGGVPCVYIRKEDCKIISVSHGK